MLFGVVEQAEVEQNNSTLSLDVDSNHQRCLNYYNNLKKKRKLERDQQASANSRKETTPKQQRIIHKNMTEATSPLKISNIILVVTWIVLAYIAGPMCSSPSSATRDLADAAAKIRIEDATGIAFSTNEKFHISGRTNMSLVGVGVRKLAILSLYSMGLYVTPSTAKSLEKQTNGNKCKSILDTTSPKIVQLKFAFGIGPERIAEALSAVNANEQVKKEFHDMIIDGMGDGKMTKGEVMSLEFKGTDMISVSIRGKYIGQLKDKALANGVIELYLGPKSVSPTLRSDLGCV